MNEQERDLDLALADAEQEIRVLNEKVSGYEALIRDLTDALRATDRNAVLEEVAKEIEQFTFAFGVDTVDSFAAFVRGMKE